MDAEKEVPKSVTQLTTLREQSTREIVNGSGLINDKEKKRENHSIHRGPDDSSKCFYSPG
jgi:hypothetical protein